MPAIYLLDGDDVEIAFRLRYRFINRCGVPPLLIKFSHFVLCIRDLLRASVTKLGCIEKDGGSKLLLEIFFSRSTGRVVETYISLKTTEHKSMGAVGSLFVVATAGFGWILTISPIFRKLSRVAISRQLNNRIVSRGDVPPNSINPGVT